MPVGGVQKERQMSLVCQEYRAGVRRCENFTKISENRDMEGEHCGDKMCTTRWKGSVVKSAEETWGKDLGGLCVEPSCGFHTLFEGGLGEGFFLEGSSLVARVPVCVCLCANVYGVVYVCGIYWQKRTLHCIKVLFFARQGYIRSRSSKKGSYHHSGWVATRGRNTFLHGHLWCSWGASSAPDCVLLRGCRNGKRGEFSIHPTTPFSCNSLVTLPLQGEARGKFAHSRTRPKIHVGDSVCGVDEVEKCCVSNGVRFTLVYGFTSEMLCIEEIPHGNGRKV